MKKSLFFFLISFFVLENLFAQTNFFFRLADSAATLINQKVVYDATYFKIPFPNGDVPADKGVCTDVVIRAFRKLGIDLQKEVNEDMKNHFTLYPKIWGRKAPDTNIDHRRVPNLMTFFSRKGISKPITQNNKDYLPGDIICWDLGSGLKHIGLITSVRNEDKSRFMIVHNIGGGQILEDCLFRFKIIGHYSYKP
jgi:uncharacterized protein YijF (DUF1287 family)